MARLAVLAQGGAGAYVPSLAVFHCPSYAGNYTPSWFTVPYMKSNFEVGGSYCVASYSFNVCITNTAGRPGPYSSNGGGNGRLGTSTLNNFLCAADICNATCSIINHGPQGGYPDGLNILYFDASVRWKSDPTHYITVYGPNAGTTHVASLLWMYTSTTLPP